MSVEIRDNFLMGTENGPDGPKHSVRYDLWVGGMLLSLYDKEHILAFAEWVRTSGDYMEDVAQQANAWVTPSSAPTVFSCLAEEERERMAI